MSRLRIAMVAPPWIPVPPRGYGGIELVVDLLSRELVRRGHDLTVFACQGSDPTLNVVALAEDGWFSDLGTPDQRVREATYLRRVYTYIKSDHFDIVHEHTEYPGIMVAHTLGIPVPVVATIHGRVGPKECEFLREVDQEIGLVAISEAQRASSAEVDWDAVVHNAVDPGALGFSTRKEGFLLQLARINPDKGQHISIDVARRVGMPLVLAGKLDLDRASQEYFAREIEPKLGDGVTWIRDVAGEEKKSLLARATAMLFPIAWDEPFGLAMVEAMASGTPVIGFPRGAARELIEPGITGFLGESPEELADLVRRAGEIDPEGCRRRVIERFSPSRMTDGYEAVYELAMASYSADFRPGGVLRPGRRRLEDPGR